MANLPEILLGQESRIAFSALCANPAKPLVLLLQDEESAQSVCEDIRALAQIQKRNVKAEFLSSDIQTQRAATLEKLLRGEVEFLALSQASWEAPCFSPDDFSKRQRLIRAGENLIHEDFLKNLAEGGYERADFVSEAGECAVRGEVLDVWVASQKLPSRIVFDGDRVESLREFDPQSQRSVGPLSQLSLFPVSVGQGGNIADYLGDASRLLMEKESLPVSSALVFPGEVARTCESLRGFLRDGFEIWTFCHNEGERERLQDVFKEHSFLHEEVGFALAPLSSGLVLPAQHLAIFTEHEIFGRALPRSRPRPYRQGPPLESLTELSEGDYVVHERFGIGRYLGLQHIQTSRHEGDFLAIEYAGGDKLYVAAMDFALIQKYVGQEGKAPRLYSLDGEAWGRARSRASEAAKKLAKELLEIYARRTTLPGYAFPKESHIEEAFAKAFLYEETPDQTRAIREVKEDQQRSRPMDRLVFGDVGYGKTEVAMRAALKVALEGKQAAVLVPTTLLAEQHFETFRDRFADYPVSVAVLSRLQGPSQNKKVLVELAKGTVDIAIGTHRLFSKDVRFRDLGLLVIDEEHRFGVRAKETLRKLKANVDTLTLTATPIPRTLSMALSAIRDVSVIQTPPLGRQAVETKMMPYDESFVTEAITRETARRGQVFFIHNRIATLPSELERLQKILPGIRFAAVHGKLSPRELENKMLKFLHREVDVLVATSIIESGLDIPNVNTLLVTNAEKMGLAQLYQLRGRVGRGARRALCAFFYDPQNMTAEGKKRLKALSEFTALGSGFRLAMRDLEIRGAGNILGAEQHGILREVGFEMYFKLLSLAVGELRGEPAEEPVNPDITLAASGYFPSSYIASEESRIGFYKRLLLCPSAEEIDRLADELADRFGKMPAVCEDLFRVAQIRMMSRALKILALKQEGDSLRIIFDPRANVSIESLLNLSREYSGRLRFVQGKQFELRFFLENEGGALQETKSFLKKLLEYATMKAYVPA